jgi:hypothetical protein
MMPAHATLIADSVYMLTASHSCCSIVRAGLANIVAALAQHAPGVSAGKGISSSSILPMATAEDLAAWQRLDDVIMVRGWGV